MTFRDVVMVSYDNREFLKEFDRLTGSNLCRHGSPLELAIDDASGRRDREMEAFIAFVKDLVWDRLPPEAFEAVRKAPGLHPEG